MTSTSQGGRIWEEESARGPFVVTFNGRFVSRENQIFIFNTMKRMGYTKELAVRMLQRDQIYRQEMKRRAGISLANEDEIKDFYEDEIEGIADYIA